MKYDQNVIEQVQASVDITDVIGQYVPLKRAGRNFKGSCPFHQEKTPSFTVHPEKQIFHCFGCGVGGDVFSFLMRYENMNFPEAIRLLAERAHIVLPERDAKDDGISTEMEQLHAVYGQAAEFYQKLFQHPEVGKPAREYLAKRGFRQEFGSEFGIGWAPESWRNLFDHLSKKGFSESSILKSGLIQKSSQGRCFDVFRGRVIFPIQNLRGKVIGFGGRIITAAGDGPKYLNSSESLIFRKRKELFGLYQAKKHIDPDRSRILVVEGYMDFYRLYEGGFKNVVATLGTALTMEHVRLLKRFVQEAIVIYDGDKAGESASLRGLEIFLEEGMNVKLVRMPSGNDPDDFLRDKGPAAFQKLIDEAKDFFDYKVEILTQKYSVEDPVGVVKFTNNFLETLSKIKSPILLAYYLKRLSNAVHLDENSLRTELAKMTKDDAMQTKRVEGEGNPLQGKSIISEEVLLFGLILQDPSMLEEAMEQLQEEDFENPELKNLFRRLSLLEEKTDSLKGAKLFSTFNDEHLKSQLAGTISNDWSQEVREQMFYDCLKKIKKRNLNRKLDQLRVRIAKAEKEGDQAKVGQFVHEYQTLLRSMAHL